MNCKLSKFSQVNELQQYSKINRFCCDWIAIKGLNDAEITTSKKVCPHGNKQPILKKIVF